MATYQTQYNLRYGNAGLRNQVVIAMAKAAYDVLNESPSTENHAARVAWAKAVINDGSKWADLFLWSCALNPTIAQKAEDDQEITDSDVQFVVNSNINPAIALAAA